jgi:hypothetical protein
MLRDLAELRARSDQIMPDARSISRDFFSFPYLFGAFIVKSISIGREHP